MKKNIKEIIKHPLFAGSAIMVIGSNSGNALNYLYHLILGRMLGPPLYGELAAILSLIGLLGIIPGALSLVIIKYVSGAKTNQEAASLITFLKAKSFQASAVSSILIIAISPIIFSFLHITKIFYIILIAIIFFFALPAGFNRAILQGLLKFKEMIITVLIETGGKLLLSIMLIYFGFRVGGAMLSFAIAVVLGWFLTGLYLKSFEGSNPKKPKNIKAMTKFVVPVTIQYFAITSLYSSDLILVKHFFSPHEAGLYAALSTLGKIIFFSTGPIAAAMFPFVSQRQSRGQNFKKIFILSFLMTTSLASLVLIVYWLFPKFAIFLLYGSAYLEASNLLVWFGIFMTLFTISCLFVSYALSLGKTKVVLLPLIAAISQIILIWFFHDSLYRVILISIVISALLLFGLLIYSSLWKKDLWRLDLFL